MLKLVRTYFFTTNTIAIFIVCSKKLRRHLNNMCEVYFQFKDEDRMFIYIFPLCQALQGRGLSITNQKQILPATITQMQS